MYFELAGKYSCIYIYCLFWFRNVKNFIFKDYFLGVSVFDTNSHDKYFKNKKSYKVSSGSKIFVFFKLK